MYVTYVLCVKVFARARTHTHTPCHHENTKKKLTVKSAVANMSRMGERV